MYREAGTHSKSWREREIRISGAATLKLRALNMKREQTEQSRIAFTAKVYANIDTRAKSQIPLR